MKLAAWRQTRGLTQQELADELDVHLLTVQRWEQGRRQPGAGDLKRLFLLSDGAVEPNDFHDLPLWRRALRAAIAALDRHAA